MMDRRQFLKLASASAGSLAGHSVRAASPAQNQLVTPTGPADHTIRIGAGLIEAAPDKIISAKTYNGGFPGPLLRFKEGRRVVVDIYNDTDTPEQFHWHGQRVPVEADGAAEEGTPFVPAHGMRRITFTPGPTGFRTTGSSGKGGRTTGRGTVWPRWSSGRSSATWRSRPSRPSPRPSLTRV